MTIRECQATRPGTPDWDHADCQQCGGMLDFTKMDNLQRDTALLGMISDLTNITALQDEQMDELAERVKTLELSITV